MGDLSRIGVAIDSDLLRRFDRFIAQKGYENRSEAFRDLIRDRLVGSAVVAPEAFVVGTVTLIYDHHTRLLPEKLTDLQHEHHHVIISTLHAHLDHESCLEVVVLRGKSKDVQELADRLIYAKSRVPFVQANLLESQEDDPQDVEAFRNRLQKFGVWANEPVPLFPYPGSPDYTRRWGNPDERAWERAHEHYLKSFDEFSDIQEQRPLPLIELERSR